MLTRLRVTGFKNLVDTEVTFGPFTCVAGANAVGKSNLFDAIMFLRDLANFPIIEAATRVRDPNSREGDITSLFSSSRGGISKSLGFDCDFITPLNVLDDFGRPCAPSTSFLNYKISFGLEVEMGGPRPKIVLTREELTYIQKGDAASRLGFKHSKKFRDSIVIGRRTTPYISFETENSQGIIKLHQDGGSSGRAFRVQPQKSPRTILGGANTNDQPTVLAARREMQSWMLLQLEPSALRRPDDFSADPHISESGEHVPATLARLGTDATIATELSELLPEIRSVYVDSDDGRRLRTLNVESRDGVHHAARSLSDGTLRFLALAVLRSDAEAARLLCLEEPENGIHPSRINAILDLLDGIAVNPNDVVDDSNPLRQVIVNTHSPVVVRSLPVDALIVAKSLSSRTGSLTTFNAISGTWRTEVGAKYKMAPAQLGDLLSYLEDRPRLRENTVGDEKTRTVVEFVRQAELPFMLDKNK